MYTEKSRAALAILVVCLPYGNGFCWYICFWGIRDLYESLVSIGKRVGLCFVDLVILVFLLVCLLLGDLCWALGDLGQVPTLVV